MVSPEPEHRHLFTSCQGVVWVYPVVEWMLLNPMFLLYGLNDGLGFIVACGPVSLLLLCSFLCQGVSSRFAKQVAVGRNPL